MASSEEWVFTGAGSSPTGTTPIFPAGVFSPVAIAEAWNKQHGLSGTLTLYRMTSALTFEFLGDEIRRCHKFVPFLRQLALAGLFAGEDFDLYGGLFTNHGPVWRVKY